LGENIVPGLKIQPEEREGLAKLRGLSEQTANSLLSAIKLAAGKANVDSLTDFELPEISNLSPTDADLIIRTVDSLYHVRAFAEIGLEEFVVDVCDSLESDEETSFFESESALEEFRRRLTDFLGIAEVNRAAKSTVLRYEQERPVHDVRILTDARPIFGDDATAAPEAAVILHTLKIAYHFAGRLEELFFSLDERDLEELKKAVHRAELKAINLASVLSNAEMKIYKLE
jgi:hypothetical protein